MNLCVVISIGVNIIVLLELVGLVRCWTKSPAFPEPFGANPTDRKRLQIISESFDQSRGYSSSQEFSDLDAGKSAQIETKANLQTTIFGDSDSGATYRYKPYSCDVYQYSAGLSSLPDDIDRSSLSVANIRNASSHKNGLYLFGVTAIWYNAAKMSKVYTSLSAIYSATKDIVRPAHKWTVQQAKAGADGNVLVHLYFFEIYNSHTRLSELSLETIEFEDKQKSSIVTTINVVSVEREFDDDVYNKELELPIIYGCKRLISDPELENKLKFWDGPIEEEFKDRMKLKIFAKGSGGANNQASDSISFESITSAFRDHRSEKIITKYQLIRQRSFERDRKLVIDSLATVQWDIDLKRGTCLMRNSGSTSYDNLDYQKIVFQFSNGLLLETSGGSLRDLLAAASGFNLAKVVEDQSGTHIYTTKDIRNIFDTVMLGRVVRHYFAPDDGTDRIRLIDVVVWVMNGEPSKRSDIHETYRFEVIESQSKLSEVDKARLFDVSDECYLDSKQMQYGLDYAWLELYYPVPVPLIRLISQKVLELKENFYRSIEINSRLSFQRIPKMEVTTDETGFTLRMLILDSAPAHIAFSSTSSIAIKPDLSNGDLSSLEPDVKRCSLLCRLHQCQEMSFCPDTFECVLSQASGEQHLDPEDRNGCTYYRQSYNTNDADSLRRPVELQKFIAQLQRHDFGDLKLPEEPQDDGQYDDRADSYAQRREDYAQKVSALMEERGLAAVSITQVLFGFVAALVPSSFRVDQDPLAEFGLANKDDELDPNQLPPFHQGLNAHRYNYRAFEDTEVDEDGRKTDARQYAGIDYDQCALACVDGKCQSFSYCRHRQECVITNIHDIKSNEMKYIMTDSDCFIAQRDFLSKFNKFPGVSPPNAVESGKRVQVASNPSECAHSCVLEADFNCLGFTYCKEGKQDAGAGGKCAYSDSRALPAGGGGESTGCDHYSRSYLGDFVRIEYRQLAEETLASLSTSSVEGQSVDKCAEICASELPDCSAFQFCFDPEANNGKARQQCTMIESPPAESREDWKVVLDQAGRVVSAGKLFASNQNCHVFSMRKSSSEAELRRLAFNPLSKDEQDSEAEQSTAGGLTLLTCLILFACTTVAFSLAGIGFLATQRNSARIRERIHHIRSLFMRY